MTQYITLNDGPGVAANGPGVRRLHLEPLATVRAITRRWLYLPDDRSLLAMLGTVAANRLPGDPAWLVFVGPPGGGKSEQLQMLIGLPDVHPVATLTEAALLSGTVKRERDPTAKGGLLREIGDFGIVLAKDFGSVLSMNRDTRAALLAALREVYDGSWTRHVGADGGRALAWSGKIGLIAGCTGTIDRHHAVMGAMGERFILFRLPEVDVAEQGRRALAHAGTQSEMRAELASAVTALFANGLPAAPLPRSQADDERLVSLATVVVRCRSAVERDGYSREIELIPDAEAPTRLVVVLAQLLSGLDAIGVDREEGWSVVTKAALDSIPAIRRMVIDVLYRDGDLVTTSDLAEAISYPTNTTRRTLEDLTAHDVVERTTGGEGKADLWSLSGFTRTGYALALGVPEMSVPPLTPSNNPNHACSDISGEV